MYQWTNEVAQSCLTLCDPMDCSLPGPFIRGIFQARVLEWIAISFSRGSSRPGDRTQVSRIAGRRFPVWAVHSGFFDAVPCSAMKLHEQFLQTQLTRMCSTKSCVKSGSYAKLRQSHISGPAPCLWKGLQLKQETHIYTIKSPCTRR